MKKIGLISPNGDGCAVLKKVLVIMKITLLLLLTTTFNLFATGIYSQTAKVSLHFNQVSIKQVLKEVEKSSEFYFLYNDNLVDVDKKVDIQVDNEPINTILAQLFDSKEFKYEVYDRQIVISPSGMELTQIGERKISGKITDNQGIPLPGVTVVVKGSTIGSITDAGGKYTLTKIPENSTLIFSFVGMISQEIVVGKMLTINVVMIEQSVGIEEVVAVGYGTQKKESLTGAVSQVKMNEILGNRPVSNLTTVLQGAIPGMQITSSSGRPGESASIDIRGVMSINGGNPLILVDNVPMAIDALNPTDIESVSVLKDASSSSIYGGRAAFGVILITTKKASRNQKLKFNYSSNFTINQPSDIPEKATTYETNIALKAFGNTTKWTGQNLDTWNSLLVEYQNDPSKYPDGETVVNGTRYRLAQDDLYKKFMTNSLDHMHNLSFSGGSEKSTFRVSFGYANEDGVMLTNKDSYHKINLNAYLNTDLTANLTSSLNILYKNDTRYTPSSYSLLFNNAFAFGPEINSGIFTSPDGTKYPFNTTNNILENEPPERSLGEDLRLFEKLEYRILPDLKLIGEYTYRKTNSNYIATKTKNLYCVASSYSIEQLNTESSYTRSNSSTDYSALNIYASYDKKINQHNFKLLVGVNQEESKYSYFDASKLKLISIDTPSLSTASGTMSNSDSFSDYSVLGYFSRLNYAYKDKYLVEANARYDGSSRFPDSGRYGFFPSFSAGWVVSEESFMKPIQKVVNFLKLRGSWGEIGNQAIANYAYIPAMGTRNASWVDPATAVRLLTIDPPSLVSSSFTWETVRTKNIGVDLSFFSNRLKTTFEYYNRETLNMLGPASELPAVLGASAPLKNVADLESKGWETSFVWNGSAKDFRYSLGFNLSDNRGFVTRFDNQGGLLSQYYNGYEFGEIWGYETNGYFTTDDFVSGTLDANLMNGTLKPGVPSFYTTIKPNPGDIKFVDLNNDGKISPGTNTLSDPGDLKIIGNNNRRFQYGINGSCSYRNFDLSFFIQGIGKRDLWISNELFWPYYDTFMNLYKHQLDYWTPENPNAFYPRSYTAAGGNTATSRNVQTKYLSNGAYLRFKNIEIGYNLPKSVVNKLKIESTRFFVSAENLFTFDHLPKGMDAEIANSARGLGYPFIKKISLGLNLSF